MGSGASRKIRVFSADLSAGFFLCCHSMSAVSFLISDPSPALQTFMQQVLSGYGFDAAAIKTTSSPQAAAEIAASLKPDFLITDWFAKEPLCGIDLYRAVVKTNPDCRFALMAQGSSPTQAQEANAAGALFLLPKPFTADAARSQLARALEQLAPLHPAIAQHVSTHAQHHAPAEAPGRPTRVQLPSLPQYKSGDRVRYKNRTESVKHVILRRGELVVQLQDVPGLIEATQITRL